FAKYPEPGRVKTRLARAIGLERAALLYKEMIETVVRRTAPLPLPPPSRGGGGGEGEYRRTLCFDPPERENDFRKWLPSLDLRRQGGGDLGQRMSAAFQESLANDLDRTVLIGTDCTEIDRSLLCDAFQQLEGADLVLGPAKDGGYYLIGMKKAHPFLFEEIPWSTNKVLHETLQKAGRENLKIELLKTLSDIDE
ncbi:MAG: TIGR04282 family arsenosugar biosynthesis glycosyltransferase, partial [Deltaproteobacteria bacterium]|nr:TIGR04282 family arsenosugar biosynthesis glycosyltransferase [Deltaproteobacteria bacterium]